MRQTAISIDSAADKNIREIMERIDKARAMIDEQITGLDRDLDKVLEKNERDFLTAYRFHMLKVQSELMQLKKKANDTELRTLQDSKLSELDKE